MKKKFVASLFSILFAQLLLSSFALQENLPPQHLLPEQQSNDAGYNNSSYSISTVVKNELLISSKGGQKGGTGGANVVHHPRPSENRTTSLSVFISTATAAFCVSLGLLLIFPF